MNKKALILVCTASAILICFLSSLAQKPGEVKFDLGSAGTVCAPENWKVAEKGADYFRLAADDGLGEALFMPLKDIECNDTDSYLKSRAKEIGLPEFPRQVEKKWLDKCGVESGVFIHGTVALTSEQAAVVEAGDSAVVHHPPSRYWVLAVYHRGGKCWLMEAWIENLPGGAMTLNRLQRTWSWEK